MSFSWDNEFLIVCTLDGTANLIKSRDQISIIKSFIAHKSIITSTKFISNEVLTASKDGTIKSWDTKSGKKVR